MRCIQWLNSEEQFAIGNPSLAVVLLARRQICEDGLTVRLIRIPHEVGTQQSTQ